MIKDVASVNSGRPLSAAALSDLVLLATFIYVLEKFYVKEVFLAETFMAYP